MKPKGEGPHRVDFRVFHDHPGDVVALFPECPDPEMPGACLAFSGGRFCGGAAWESVKRRSRPARADEYDDVLLKLMGKPHRLNLIVIAHNGE